MKDTWTESHSSICNCVMHINTYAVYHVYCGALRAYHRSARCSWNVLRAHETPGRNSHIFQKIVDWYVCTYIKRIYKVIWDSSIQFLSCCLSLLLTFPHPPASPAHGQTCTYTKSPSLDLLFQALVLSPGLRRESARVWARQGEWESEQDGERESGEK